MRMDEDLPRLHPRWRSPLRTRARDLAEVTSKCNCSTLEDRRQDRRVRLRRSRVRAAESRKTSNSVVMDPSNHGVPRLENIGLLLGRVMDPISDLQLYLVVEYESSQLPLG